MHRVLLNFQQHNLWSAPLHRSGLPHLDRNQDPLLRICDTGRLASLRPSLSSAQQLPTSTIASTPGTRAAHIAI